MSENDSDSEQSYCSDDSEFNYIPGPYVIEAIEVELSRITNRRQLRPLASEEWLSEYVKKARNPGRL